MSSVGYGPLERIDGPPPAPPVYSLIATATAPASGVRIIPDVDANGIERWMNGVEVYPYPPDQGDVYDPCAPGSVATTKGFGSTLKHPQFGAMTVHVDETCTSYKVWSQDEFKARASMVLAAIESSIVAREFMNGSRMPANPHLADGNGTFPNADVATSFSHGIGLLEDAISASGRQGLIHMSPGLASSGSIRFGWNYWNDLRAQVVRMISGTVIIPDSGYAGGRAPTGHSQPTSTQEWVYATGPIDIRRSEIFVQPDNVSQALERGTGGASARGENVGGPNSITYRAERYVLVDWDTEVQAAVLIDRCLDACVVAT